MSGFRRVIRVATGVWRCRHLPLVLIISACSSVPQYDCRDFVARATSGTDFVSPAELTVDSIAEEALRNARKIQDRRKRDAALVEIVQSAVKLGNFELAQMTANEIHSIKHRLEAYRSIGEEIANAGDFNGARAILRLIRSTQVEPTDWRAVEEKDRGLINILRGISYGQARTGDLAAARETVDEARREIRSSCCPAQEEYGFPRSLAEAGHFDEALEIAGNSSGFSEFSLLVEIAQLQIDAGKTGDALRTLERAALSLDFLRQPEDRFAALRIIGGVYKRLGATSTAEQLLRDAVDALLRVEPKTRNFHEILEIIETFDEIGARTSAREALEKLINFAADHPDIPRLRSDVIERHAFLGKWDLAWRKESLIGETSRKNDARVAIARAYALRGEDAEARRIIEGLRFTWVRCRAMAQIAWAQIQRSDPKAALTTIEMIEDPDCITFEEAVVFYPDFPSVPDPATDIARLAMASRMPETACRALNAVRDGRAAIARLGAVASILYRQDKADAALALARLGRNARERALAMTEMIRPSGECEWPREKSFRLPSKESPRWNATRKLVCP